MSLDTAYPIKAISFSVIHLSSNQGEGWGWGIYPQLSKRKKKTKKKRPLAIHIQDM